MFTKCKYKIWLTLIIIPFDSEETEREMKN